MRTRLPPLELRVLDRANGEQMHELNRACPISADFVFFFDRTPDFFAWPDAVFESYVYVGGFRRDRLVAYALFALARGRVDGGDRFAWSGDVRVLPEARGAGFLEAAARSVAPTAPPPGIGVALIKQGNVAAARSVAGLHVPGVEISRLCEFNAVSLLLLRRPSGRGRFVVRRACLEDVPGMVSLMRRAWSGRPFAPPVGEEELVRDAARLPGFGLDRYYLAFHRSQLVGALGVWNGDALRRITILRDAGGARVLRAVHAIARRLLRSGTPLPAPGHSFRALTATRVAVPDGDPAILRDLLRAVCADHVDCGYHMLHVGFAGDDPLQRATDGLLRHSFRSDLIVTTPPGRSESLRSGPLPFVDLRWL